MKKVAFYIPLWCEIGGFTSYTKHLYHGLVDSGIKVTIIISSKSGKKKFQDSVKAGLPVVQIPHDQIMNCLRAYDHIHVPYLLNYFKIGDIAQLFGMKYTLTLHDPAEYRITPKEIDYFVDNASAVIFNRKPVIDFYFDKFHKKNFYLIKHPYKREGKHSAKKNIAVVTSRIDWDKHIEDIVKAIPNIKGEVHFWSGWVNPKYQFFELKDWDKKYHHVEGFTYADMGNVYGDAKILIDMSKIMHDGGGSQYTFLEAFDYGVVVVIRRDFNIGYGVSADTPDEIAQACNAIFSGKINTDKIIAGNQETLEEHNHIKIAKEYLDIWDRK